MNEEKMTAPEETQGIQEKPTDHVIVINHKSKIRISDGIRLGFGFYIGFKLARKFKYAMLAANAAK